MLSSLFMIVRYGYSATVSVKSGVEAIVWTRKMGKRLWKASPFRRKRNERNESSSQKS